MFSRKKKPPPAKEKTRTKPSMDFGLGIPGFDQNPPEDDADLEAELLALTGGRRAKNTDVDFVTGDEDEDLEAELARLVGGSSKRNQGKTSLPSTTIRGSSLQEIKNIIEPLGSDEELDVDENDPELLSELQMLTVDDACDLGENNENQGIEGEENGEECEEMSQLDLIKSRLDMYKTAEAKAKSSNESSRARRFNRGTKTLEKLLKRVQAGEIVSYDEIPPEIATSLKPAPPLMTPASDEPQPAPSFATPVSEEPQPAPPVETPVSDEPQMDTPCQDHYRKPGLADPSQTVVLDTDDSSGSVGTPRQDPTPDKPVEDPALPEYRESFTLTLLKSRRDEYKKLALTAKKSGDLTSALESVRSVKACDKLIDLYKAGNEINESEIPPSPLVPKALATHQKVTEPIQNSSASTGVPHLIGEIFTIPRTVQEALNQRLNYYTKAVRKAETMGLRSDARKLGDIVRVYQNAIRLHQRGSSVPFEKLPTPPGCPPIPLAFKI